MGAAEDANEDVLGRKLDTRVSTLVRMGSKLDGWTYVNNNSGGGQKTGESQTITDLLHQHTCRSKGRRGNVGPAEVVDHDSDRDIECCDAGLTDHQ